MIDKLEFRLPAMTLFRPKVREFMLDSRHFENSSRTVKSGRYEWRTDLRPVGIDALLHYSLKRRENEPHAGEHKLELLDTGKRCYSALVGQLESTIEGEIDDLEILRIDLCADIVGTPIEWFLNRLRIRYKRAAHEIGMLKYQRIGKAGIQTISGGMRPNIIRVYDKRAEYEEQLKRMQRRRSRESDELTLESEFGISANSVITRIERQFGGQRIPIAVDTFGRLNRLPKFNPFTNIEIFNGTGAGVPTIEECGLDTWLTGTRLRALQDEMGTQQFQRWLHVHSNKNRARYLKKYGLFLQPDRDDTVTAESIFETYRESVMRQLAA